MNELAPLPEGVDASLVAEKVRAGLTREQAVEVILNQMAEDAARNPAPPDDPPAPPPPLTRTAPPTSPESPADSSELAEAPKKTGKAR